MAAAVVSRVPGRTSCTLVESLGGAAARAPEGAHLLLVDIVGANPLAYLIDISTDSNPIALARDQIEGI